ncbi:MAG: hypothetical protein KGJ80_07890, partial [Chloroflexota bacterium]|nr:hypothetical protein [Chloroflexota bacterium]
METKKTSHIRLVFGVSAKTPIRRDRLPTHPTEMMMLDRETLGQHSGTIINETTTIVKCNLTSRV